MLGNLSSLLGIQDLEELAPDAQEAAHRDVIWAERAYWNTKRNSDRRAAFESRLALAKAFEPPHWMGPVQKTRDLAPIKIRKPRRRTAKLFDLAKARKSA